MGGKNKPYTRWNVCAICLRPERRINKVHGHVTRLAIDHDSQTGKIRGLLCASCNVSIGQFNHDINILQNAIMYLKRVP